MRCSHAISSRPVTVLKPGDLARIVLPSGGSYIALCVLHKKAPKLLTMIEGEGLILRALDRQALAICYGDDWLLSVNDSECHTTNGDVPAGDLLLLDEKFYLAPVIDREMEQTLVSLSEFGTFTEPGPAGSYIQSRGVLFSSWKISISRQGRSGPEYQDLMSFG